MSTFFQPACRVLTLTAFAALTSLAAAPAFALSTVYTSEAAFLAVVQSGAYPESFTGINDADTSYSYGSGAFGYTVTAPLSGSGLDVYLSGSFIGNYNAQTTLTVTFTSGSPTAIGGNFYLTNAADAFVAGPLTITLSDGTSTTFTAADTSAYRGFTSTSAITSLTLSAPLNPGTFNTIDNLTVGTVAAVPEPGTVALMAGGLALLAAVARRRA